MKRPNILLFMTDQHTLDALGCYGAQICKTPNIDQLAREGVRFANNYTVCPLCSPARASVLTGKEVHAHGVTSNVHEIGCNVSEIPDSPELLSRILANNNYACGYTGKWHIGDGMNKSAIGGVPLSPGTPTTRGFIGQDTPENKGGWHFSDYINYLKEMGLESEIPKYQKDYRDENGKQEVVHHNIKGTCEYFLVEKTKGLINQFSEKDEPFFIWHNTWGPHGAYITHIDYYNLYKDIDIPIPENYKITEQDYYLPANAKRTAEHKPWPDVIEEYRLYFALATQIDAMLGHIINHLKEKGLDDNTIIIFTSDHGSHFYNRSGLTDKGFSHFEEIHRTGCVVYDPRDKKNQGTVIRDYTSLLDIYPTILDLAGIAPPEGIDGASLLKLINGDRADWRDHAFIEFYGLGQIVTTMLSIIKNNIKYGWNPTNKDELYDLKKYPLQNKNLIDEPAYSKALSAMRKCMYEHLVAHRHPLQYYFHECVMGRDALQLGLKEKL